MSSMNLRRQLLRPALVLGQRLQRVVEVTPAMRPATQVHELGAAAAMAA
jgi:hypothetical protein